MADATGKLAQECLRLSEFEFFIVHRAGIKHEAADALSRRQSSCDGETPLDDEIPILTIPQKNACATKTDLTDFKFIEDPKAPFSAYFGNSHHGRHHGQ